MQLECILEINILILDFGLGILKDLFWGDFHWSLQENIRIEQNHHLLIFLIADNTIIGKSASTCS
jgi:hypothetical protein